jgi:two-component system chemotaxis sensor kinase CheA
VSDHELDFDPDELAMLRQLFRSEAEESLDQVTERVLAAGSAKPNAEALTEMMRVTHTLKGAAGTVGLDGVVDVSHRLESVLASLARETTAWLPTTADQLVEIVDGMRGYFEVAGEPAGDVLIQKIRVQIDAIARPAPEASPPFLEPPPELVLEHAPHDAPVPEPKAMLRVEPQRIDDLMSSAGELLFDRTRIERRVQLLRTLARDLARTRQALHDALGDAGMPARASLVATSRASSPVRPPCSRRPPRRCSTRSRRSAARSASSSAASPGSAWNRRAALLTHAARTLRAAATRHRRPRRAAHARGEETEFDKAVAEQLLDPITQLLRNAVAHAVEPTEERIARGKPPTATITIARAPGRQPRSCSRSPTTAAASTRGRLRDPLDREPASGRRPGPASPTMARCSTRCSVAACRSRTTPTSSPVAASASAWCARPCRASVARSR